MVLHVERRTTGQWKKIGRNELKPGHAGCIDRRSRSSRKWRTTCSGRWNRKTRSNSISEYQLDQSRVATVRAPGKISAIPVAKVKCEEGRVVEGALVEIDASRDRRADFRSRARS